MTSRYICFELDNKYRSRSFAACECVFCLCSAFTEARATAYKTEHRRTSVSHASVRAMCLNVVERSKAHATSATTTSTNLTSRRGGHCIDILCWDQRSRFVFSVALSATANAVGSCGNTEVRRKIRKVLRWRARVDSDCSHDVKARSTGAIMDRFGWRKARPRIRSLTQDKCRT